MRLSELLNRADLDPQLDAEVTGVTADSRSVQPGNLFAAMPGSTADGWNYVQGAITSGAVAVLASNDHKGAKLEVYGHYVDDPRLELAHIANRFEGARPDHVAAVTGTNGKTSVAHFTRQIWSLLGIKAASIGTLGLVTDEAVEDLHYTTPDPVLLHKVLHRLKDQDVNYLVLEASSHGLDQRRVDAAGISIAAFTNFTRDHMDYHEGAENYLKAKLGLVDRVLRDQGVAVLNADSDVFDDFSSAAAARGIKVISYGYKGQDICLKSAKSHPQGQLLSLQIEGQAVEIDLPLAGEFQALNILCALGMVMASGVAATDILSVVPKLENVPGRMELVARAQKGAGIYVDYAHTPDALETVLKSIRPHVENRLIVVFGCGGDRDKGKRPQMGAIAATCSDIAIITDDNPRSEDPEVIRAEIKAACPDGLVIGDRRAAIAKALELAAEGDVVVVAGKGHESGQVLADRTIPFDDRVVVRELIKSGGLIDG